METTNIVLDIKEFNPKEAELTTLAQSCATIDLTDLEAVKAKRLELKKARVEITTYGKALREGATKFAKDVIAREKELVAIIEPEEEKLQAIETQVKLAKEKEERKAILPARIARLEAIGEAYNEENLLDMDGSTFEGYFNGVLARKNEEARAEIARQQAEIDAKAEEQRKEQERLDWEAKSAEKAELARKEERERMEQEQRNKEAREKAEAERKEKEEAERIEREEQQKRKTRTDRVLALGLVYQPDKNAFILQDNILHLNNFWTVTMEDVISLTEAEWNFKIKNIKEGIESSYAELVEHERKAKLEADQRYQAWLTEIGYYSNETEFIIRKEGVKHVAYRAIASFQI